jgi:hypothetical protein
MESNYDVHSPHAIDEMQIEYTFEVDYADSKIYLL